MERQSMTFCLTIHWISRGLGAGRKATLDTTESGKLSTEGIVGAPQLQGVFMLQRTSQCFEFGVEELDWSAPSPELNLTEHFRDESDWRQPSHPTSVTGFTNIFMKGWSSVQSSVLPKPYLAHLANSCEIWDCSPVVQQIYPQQRKETRFP